jgi:hypothetical protein
MTENKSIRLGIIDRNTRKISIQEEGQTGKYITGETQRRTEENSSYELHLEQVQGIKIFNDAVTHPIC